MFVNVLIREL